MRHDAELANAVRQEMNVALSFLDQRPSLRYDIMRQIKGERMVKKKLSVGFVLIVILLLISATTLAAVLLKSHDITLYEGVEIVNLLPDQRQEYNVCHRLNEGYLIGGFSLGDDYIAPMEADDAIVMLDQHFQVQWTLMDEQLQGCLLDKVLETEDSVLMGTERLNEEWLPAIMRLDKTGTLLWLYEGEPSFRMNDFSVDSENNVYCVGSRQTADAQQACILKLNASGKAEWEKSYSDLALSAFTAAKRWRDTIVLAGYSDTGAWIGGVSADGTLSWQRQIETKETVQTVRIQESEAGHLVLTVLFASSEDTAAEQISYFALKDEIPYT